MNEFFSWILLSGGSISVVSFLVERVEKFQMLLPEQKEYVFFGLSAVVAVGAYLVMNFVPVEILALVDPYFKIVAGLFSTIIVSKMFHSADKIT